MNIAVVAVGALILATTPALAAGFERAMVPDPDGPALEAGIWYPSDAPASARRLRLYTQTVAMGGEVAGRGLPLAPRWLRSSTRSYAGSLSPVARIARKRNAGYGLWA